MNILAFDCCFGAVSAAVQRPKGWPQSVRYEALQSGNAERLFPLIEEVLAEAELPPGRIDRVAVTLGPGTFTGVRVGVAAARAFSLGLRKPVVGLTSLAAMAHRARQELMAEDGSRPIVVAVDARKEMIYVQRFGGAGSDTAGPVLLAAADTAQSLGTPSKTEPLFVVGSGAAAVAEAMRADGYNCRAELPDLQPHASFVAELAPGLSPLDHVVPIYLRQPDARVHEVHSLVEG